MFSWFKSQAIEAALPHDKGEQLSADLKRYIAGEVNQLVRLDLSDKQAWVVLKAARLIARRIKNSKPGSKQHRLYSKIAPYLNDGQPVGAPAGRA